MIEQVLHHHIQKYIISVLLYKKHARFSELRPPKIDTNLFSYHLKLLVRDGFIAKQEAGYTLSAAGLAYVDRVSTETVMVRKQPKVISMLLIQNSDGQVLLQKRTKQPYIDAWTLPYGKLHIEDQSIEEAARREALEKLAVQPAKVRHAGDCYIHVHAEDAIISSTLAHVFRFETDDIQTNATMMWCDPLDLPKYHLAPAVEQIVTRCFFGDEHFFAEFDCEWNSARATRQVSAEPSRR
jgi:ADP-ribose pyrophosphatase YjhB (NUDIX family)